MVDVASETWPGLGTVSQARNALLLYFFKRNKRLPDNDDGDDDDDREAWGNG